MNKAPLELIGMHDFSDKVTITLNIIKQCYKPLLKGMAYTALPIGLLGSILFGIAYSSMLSAVINNPLDNFMGSTALLMIPGYLLFILAFVLSSGYIYQFYIEYEKDKEVKFDTVFSAFKSNVGYILGTNFKLFSLFVVPILIIVAFVIFGAAAAKPLAVIGGLLYFAFIIGVIYASMPLSYFIFLSMRERLPFFEAFSKSFKLIQGRWWRTWGFFIIMYIIQMALTYLTLIPFYAVTFLDAFTGTNINSNLAWLGAMNLIVMLFATLVFSLIIITATVIVYYDLTERNEGIGLAREIDTLGEKKTDLMENEGEY